MKKNLILFLTLAIFIGCQNNQSKKIVVQLTTNLFRFDLENVDSLLKLELKEIDTATFNKYIAQNPTILGKNYDFPRLYADGFWIKKYSDSLRNDLIFNTFEASRYYFLPHPVIEKILNGFLILIVYPQENISITQHISLYLIEFDKDSKYYHTLLLAEKIKGGGFSSINLKTNSMLKDSILVQTTINESCILDLPGPHGELACTYDTTITYYKLNERLHFDPYKRISNWQIGESK